MLIDLDEVGARATKDAAGHWQVRFGVYLPGITFDKGYHVRVRVIHERDQFVRGVEPKSFNLSWHNGSSLDLWDTTVDLTANADGNFGEEGTYLYRFQLLRGTEIVTFWFADPFGRATGRGTLSAFTVDSLAQPFEWADEGFRVPEVDDLVVYELHVGEFNEAFDGLVAQLDYLKGLGVNVIELMPVTNVKEEVEWGYTPLGYFAPDDRFGGPDGMKRLVDACHRHHIAVILDAVYAHAHPEFPYNHVYETSGEPNPMMGPFAGSSSVTRAWTTTSITPATTSSPSTATGWRSTTSTGSATTTCPACWTGPPATATPTWCFAPTDTRSNPACFPALTRTLAAAGSSSAPSICPTPRGSSAPPTPTPAGRTVCCTRRPARQTGPSGCPSPTSSTPS